MRFLSLFFIVALVLCFQYAMGARLVRDAEVTPAPTPNLDTQSIQKALESAVDGFQNFLSQHISKEQLDQYKQEFDKFGETLMDKSKNIIADLSKVANANKPEPSA